MTTLTKPHLHAWLLVIASFLMRVFASCKLVQLSSSQGPVAIGMAVADKLFTVGKLPLPMMS